MPNPIDPIIIGSFGRAFGVRGWIKINSFTDPKESILDYTPWLIKKNGQWIELPIADKKINKNNASNNIIIKLPNYDAPETVKIFTNIKIAIHKHQLPKLDNDEFYCSDLIGLKVINLQNIEFGIVKDIMATGSNDVLVVEGDKKRLVPYTSSAIIKVNVLYKTILIDWDPNF